MTQKIDVYSSALSLLEEDLRGKTVVVIDVLRASSTIITALQNGAKEIIPVEDMSAAGRIAQNLDASRYLLCGEKDGEKIDGYHLGNSPFEYDEDVIKGKTLIFNTTNGTKAIVKSQHAKKVIIGSFLNMDTVVNELKEAQGEIILACAGWKSRLSLEDSLCAGLIIRKLTDGKLPEDSRDGAKLAFVLSEKYENDIVTVVSGSNHAMRLKSLGFEEDVLYCSKLNVTNVLPVLKEGTLINENG
ncbi:2-phosphosulfolactate phosphatase [bacterium]|nr:MAG: 2-phosphosulfolactate phosphatase [bacterium]